MNSKKYACGDEKKLDAVPVEPVKPEAIPEVKPEVKEEKPDISAQIAELKELILKLIDEQESCKPEKPEAEPVKPDEQKKLSVKGTDAVLFTAESCKTREELWNEYKQITDSRERTKFYKQNKKNMI